MPRDSSFAAVDQHPAEPNVPLGDADLYTDTPLNPAAIMPKRRKKGYSLNNLRYLNILIWNHLP